MLVGYPSRQFEVTKNKGDTENPDWVTTWADETILKAYEIKGYTPTGKSRMGYCAPEWIANKTNGGILLLDDFNRANTRFMQAAMEILDRQSYISWSLPKDWHIILSCNPEGGDYLVENLDSAQKTRYISANLKFDIKTWAKWAEKEGIDSRC